MIYPMNLAQWFGLLAIALLDSPWKAIAVFGLYFLIQQLEGSVLIPLVMQEQAALLPAVTLVSQVAFTLFFGFLGLLLSLPLLVVAQICIQEMPIKDVLDRWKRQSEVPYRFNQP
jgi:predicted PurR-regulated permease PerM